MIGERRVGARAEQKRRWDRENYLICACGLRRARHSQMCDECRKREKREARDLKWEAIQREWFAGKTMEEIAAAQGSTRGSIARKMHMIRAAGWDLPYRRVPKLADWEVRSNCRPMASGVHTGRNGR